MKTKEKTKTMKTMRYVLVTLKYHFGNHKSTVSCFVNDVPLFEIVFLMLHMFCNARNTRITHKKRIVMMNQDKHQIGSTVIQNLMVHKYSFRHQHESKSKCVQSSLKCCGTIQLYHDRMGIESVINVMPMLARHSIFCQKKSLHFFFWESHDANMIRVPRSWHGFQCIFETVWVRKMENGKQF